MRTTRPWWHVHAFAVGAWRCRVTYPARAWPCSLPRLANATGAASPLCTSPRHNDTPPSPAQTNRPHHRVPTFALPRHSNQQYSAGSKSEPAHTPPRASRETRPKDRPASIHHRSVKSDAQLFRLSTFAVSPFPNRSSVDETTARPSNRIPLLGRLAHMTRSRRVVRAASPVPLFRGTSTSPAGKSCRT